MSKKVLVAYATKRGSTIKVAQEIGDTTSQHGLSVDVKPIKEISDISGYDTAIIGSAIRMAQWLPEATDFIKSHQKTPLKELNARVQGGNPSQAQDASRRRKDLADINEY